MNTNHHNRNCVIVARSATDDEGDHDIRHQLEALRRFAVTQEMTCVGEISLVMPWGIPPQVVESLISRKRLKNDFDTLLVADASRITRGGCLEFNGIRHRLKENQIEVLIADSAIEVKGNCSLANPEKQPENDLHLLLSVRRISGIWLVTDVKETGKEDCND